MNKRKKKGNKMVKYLENKKASLILITVCFLTYTIIGLTRNAYNAAIVGIIKEGYFTKTDAGIIATSFNITYCISQIAGSYFVDRVSPFKLIVFAAVVTILANIAMSLNPTYWMIFIARGICGIAQFGVWPALFRILSEYINKCYRNTWRYILPLGISFGTVISYLGAAIIPNWRGLFTFSYTAMAIATIVFIITVIYAEKKAVVRVKENNDADTSVQIKKNTHKETGVLKLLSSTGAFFLVIPVLVKTLINSGISSWMPTMIMESYGVSPSFSSTMSTISTCANFAAVLWVMIFYPRIFKLQTTASGMFFVFMLPFLIGTAIYIGIIPVLWIVIFITVINTLSGAIHQFYTVEFPKAYTKFNKAGMMAGLINAIATVGSIISSWLWGVMADSYNWNVIIWTWVIMALVAACCSFAATPLWKKTIRN